MSKVVPFLWFADGAREAAEFYVSLFDDGRMLWVQEFPPGPMESGVYTLAFELGGTTYYAINGGDAYRPTPAFSMFVEVETQAEIDRLWDALLAGGGTPMACGWLTDRFGVSWQICPKQLWEFYQSDDPVRVTRVAEAMLGMVKLDLPALQAAYDG